MAEDNVAVEVANKWKRKRGSLIMALHEIQEVKGYVPWEDAATLAEGMGVPLAKIYEVLTFYNFFKLESPGKVVVSVCTGTACYLKGNDKVVTEFQKELGIKEGETDQQGNFHLQSVRCVGCCGLAPVTVINGKTYGRITHENVKEIVEEWKQNLAENKG